SGDGTIFTADLEQANFLNCIIFGTNNHELLFDKTDNAAFNYTFTNCLIKFDDFNSQFADDPLYDFSNSSLFENIILNEDPDFKDPQKQDFKIGEESAGINQGNEETATDVPLDLLGIDRTNSPDLGAY